MAKPILLIRIDYRYIQKEDRLKFREELKEVEKEYHVICSNVGAPVDGISFEVHGVCSTDFGQLKTEINAKDISVLLSSPNMGSARDSGI